MPDLNKNAFAPSFWLNNLVYQASRMGISASMLFIQAGLPVPAGQQHRRISIYDLDLLLQAYLALAPNKDQAILSIGCHPGWRRVGELGPALLTANSLGQAMACFSEYRELVHPFAQFNLLQEGQNANLKYRPCSELAATPRYALLLYSSILTFARLLVARPLKPVLVALPFAEPEDVSVYEKAFGCEMQFNAQDYSLQFDPVWLMLPIPSADADLHKHCLHQLDLQLKGFDCANTLQQRVSDVMWRLVGEGVRLDAVARQFHVSPRTLQRQLKVTGAVYSSMRQQVLYQAASQQLLYSGLPVASIALNLGFSESAAFVRAFKQWAGATPNSYRKQLAMHCGASVGI